MSLKITFKVFSFFKNDLFVNFSYLGVTPVRPPMIIPPPGIVTLPVVTPTLAIVSTSIKTESISSISCIPITKIATPVSTVADVKPLASMPATVATPTSQAAESAVSDAQKQKLEELEKQLAEEQEPQTLQQQENMMIKGTNARHILMQKLMRRTEVKAVSFSNLFLLNTKFLSYATCMLFILKIS